MTASSLRFLWTIWLIWGVSCLAAQAARADLHPDQVAILANASSRESLAVARYYAHRRRIPLSHLIALPLPDRDTLSRAEYDQLVVAPLRAALEQAGLASAIRVLVTTYGVPLRVAAPVLSAEETRWLSEAQKYVRTSRSELEALQLQIAGLTTGAPSPAPGTDQPGSVSLESARAAVLLSRIDQTLRAVLHQLQRSSPSPETRQRLIALVRRYGGWAMVLPRAKSTDEPADVAIWRTLLERTGSLWSGLALRPIGTHRPLIYRWAERLFGLRGILELASAEVDRLDPSQADAALDSEVSLLWWDRELAPAAWRQPNPLFAGANPAPLPILMVSRLDAPTPDLAKGLVDKALQAERDGLRGSVYLDARGLAPAHPADTYGHYDQSLRAAAEFLRRSGVYPVILDNTEKTFAAPGEAPDVAFYIGWYRLRAYENAFSFNPGAIGYHMASAEAISVHDGSERGWCKNALEHGITATLGSVGEPYLDAFPEPAEFLRLVLTGKYSLVESYYLTSRYVSWRMTLFGDPLYNPMRGREHATSRAEDRLPPPPSIRPLVNPTAELRRLKQEGESKMNELVRILLEAEAPTPQPRE